LSVHDGTCVDKEKAILNSNQSNINKRGNKRMTQNWGAFV